MEVHHHSGIHHKQKKWKEYLLEFAMIFLAVTMGFIESYTTAMDSAIIAAV